MDPAVGIIPLGTGNDLSRVLGWGTSYSDSDCSGIVNSLDNISVVKLDRLIQFSNFIIERKLTKRLMLVIFYQMESEYFVKCIEEDKNNKHYHNVQLFRNWFGCSNNIGFSSY